MVKPNLDHPTLAIVKEKFASIKFLVSEFRGQTSLVLPCEQFHEVMAFLRDDSQCQYDFLADVIGLDYQNYPASGTRPEGRFSVAYNLVSTSFNRRLIVKVMLNPTLDTKGIVDDPGLHLPTITDLWPGAEWSEREVFDMFGIYFDNHPDLRRILLWDQFPGHPLRKDYPLKGHGEREQLRVITREDV